MYPGLSFGKSLIEGSLIVEKQHPTQLLYSTDQHSCHKRTITDTNVDSVALEKHLMVDAPKNLKLEKKKKKKLKL